MSYDEDLKAARALSAEARVDEAELLLTRLTADEPRRPAAFVLIAELAQKRRDWSGAELALQECLARFPAGDVSAWVRARAWSLLQLGRLDEAEVVLLSQGSPEDDPRKLALGAEIAMRRHDWHAAATRWDLLVARFPDRLEPTWRLSHAAALDRAGRLDDAEAAYGAAVTANPSNRHAALRYLQLLGRPDPPDAAFAEMRDGRFRDTTDYDLLLAGARLALRTDDMAYLRQALDRLIPLARNGLDCLALFPTIAPAFEGWQKTQRWLALERCLDRLREHGADTAPGQAAITRMRIKLALRDYPGFLALLDIAPETMDPVWLRRFRRLGATLGARPFPDYNQEKVFGIGLSKTGTTSLAHALETLGYLTAHYQNDFTFEMLSSEDAHLYDALTDTPVCTMFETLFHAYPNSRFIYTTRPMAEWVASYEGHYRRHNRTAEFGALREALGTPGATRYGASRARTAVPLFYAHADPEAARRAFEARLDDFFTGDRRDRLLVLDIFGGEGWARLCSFLGREQPDQPFPWNNRSRDLS